LILKGAGNKPGMKITSQKRIRRLNADRVDDRDASQLLPVSAQCSNDNPPPGPTWTCTAWIRVPHAGMLLMNGSAAATYSGPANRHNEHYCVFKLDGDYLRASWRDFTVGWEAMDEDAVCASNAWRGVAAGNHKVEFEFGALGPADLGETSMWALWIPT
jgi:hypothetical protein